MASPKKSNKEPLPSMTSLLTSPPKAKQIDLKAVVKKPVIERIPDHIDHASIELRKPLVSWFFIFKQRCPEEFEKVKAGDKKKSKKLEYWLKGDPLKTFVKFCSGQSDAETITFFVALDDLKPGVLHFLNNDRENHGYERALLLAYKLVLKSFNLDKKDNADVNVDEASFKFFKQDFIDCEKRINEINKVSVSRPITLNPRNADNSRCCGYYQRNAQYKIPDTPIKKKKNPAAANAKKNKKK